MKDNNNLLSHNQWSAGEYENSKAQSMDWGATVYKTNEYSIVGESSLKVIRTESTHGVRFNYSNSIINKTITARLSLRTENTIWVALREMNSNDVINQTTSSFTGIGDVELLLSSSNNNSSFQIQLYGIPDGNIVFVDNLRLVSS